MGPIRTIPDPEPNRCTRTRMHIQEEALNTAGQVGKAYTDTVTGTGDKQVSRSDRTT